MKSVMSGLYYKPMTIVNDESRVINKLEASLTDDARVVIYDRHMFIVQATVETQNKVRRFKMKVSVFRLCWALLVNNSFQIMMQS
jgi:hypothetical protein